MQVKSRYASDISYGFPVKAATFGAFDFLIAVFMNIGNFRNCGAPKEHRRQPEFFTLPRGFVKRYHNADSSWEKVRLRGMKLDKYRNEVGFELIAKALKIKRPRRAHE